MDFSNAALLQFVHIPKACKTDSSTSVAHCDTQETTVIILPLFLPCDFVCGRACLTAVKIPLLCSKSVS